MIDELGQNQSEIEKTKAGPPYRREQDSKWELIEEASEILHQQKYARPNDYHFAAACEIENACVYEAYSKLGESHGENKGSHPRLSLNMIERRFEQGNSGFRYSQRIRLIDPKPA